MGGTPVRDGRRPAACATTLPARTAWPIRRPPAGAMPVRVGIRPASPPSAPADADGGSRNRRSAPLSPPFALARFRNPPRSRPAKRRRYTACAKNALVNTCLAILRQFCATKRARCSPARSRARLGLCLMIRYHSSDLPSGFGSETKKATPLGRPHLDFALTQPLAGAPPGEDLPKGVHDAASLCTGCRGGEDVATIDGETAHMSSSFPRK